MAQQVGQLEHSEEMLREAQIRMGEESLATELLIKNLRDQGRLDEAIQLLLETGGDTVAAPLDDDPYWAIARGNHEAVDRHIAKRLEDGSSHRAAYVAYADGRYDLTMQYLEEWWPVELECPSRRSAWLLANFPELVDRPRFQEMMDVAGIPWRESEVWAEWSP